MHTRYSFDPIKIHATRREVDHDEYNHRLDTMGITETGQSQAIMEMVKNTYMNDLENLNLNVSTDIHRMHMDPQFWYQQHTLVSDVHHLNKHMIDIVQTYIRGDAT